MMASADNCRRSFLMALHQQLRRLYKSQNLNQLGIVSVGVIPYGYHRCAYPKTSGGNTDPLKTATPSLNPCGDLRILSILQAECIVHLRDRAIAPPLILVVAARESAALFRDGVAQHVQ